MAPTRWLSCDGTLALRQVALAHHGSPPLAGHDHDDDRFAPLDADYHLVPPPEGEGDCYSLGLYCSNADALVFRAERAGGDGPRAAHRPRLLGPLTEHPRPLRRPLVGPHPRVEDLSEAESARRVADWAAQQG